MIITDIKFLYNEQHAKMQGMFDVVDEEFKTKQVISVPNNNVALVTKHYKLPKHKIDLIWDPDYDGPLLDIYHMTVVRRDGVDNLQQDILYYFESCVDTFEHNLKNDDQHDYEVTTDIAIKDPLTFELDTSRKILGVRTI